MQFRKVNTHTSVKTITGVTVMSCARLWTWVVASMVRMEVTGHLVRNQEWFAELFRTQKPEQA